MSIFALQYLAGGFLDEDLIHFNKNFDDWCVQFKTYEDAMKTLKTLDKQDSIDIVEITPLSYPKYFFKSIQGTVYTTRQIEDKIICVVEPFIGSSFRILICDLKTKNIKQTKTLYKTIPSVEAAFANFKEELKEF
ncbi:hypothetical protein AAX26_00978 [Aliarcobacter thereius]|uniref:Uncharacterized protein n=1 Tax=Aliarcobacter thereius TaxID=544718 RepID=A0A1C0B564_9BACT|nr:hypothetical protein [Aliarcobacter thereius]OCL87881.1 hypothetical protein AAX26_00978 [Aliarcobacter thereius]OCL94136.1 hypothetical protein AAX25_00467 [Aliarcobacter thereius]OCL97561.1 hypothetical protein AAX29_01921 [Aliarcobacter thereius]